MKSLITLTAVLAAMLSVSAAANALPLDTSVKPAVTSLSNPAPKTGLYVGNSFTYYNCGLVGYVRGFAKAAGIPWRAVRSRSAQAASPITRWHSISRRMSSTPTRKAR